MTEGDSIRCTLKGDNGYAELLEESTGYLVRDIGNMVIGKPVTVSYRNGEIIIKSQHGVDY